MPPGINSRYLRFQDAINSLKFIKENYKLSEIDVDIRFTKKIPQICYVLERSFEIVILAFIDIANKLIAERDFRKPQSYKDTIEILVDHNIIDKQYKEIFVEFVNERNIITHEYAEIDYKKLYNLLDHIDKLVEYIERILSQLDKTEI